MPSCMGIDNNRVRCGWRTRAVGEEGVGEDSIGDRSGLDCCEEALDASNVD